MARHSALLTSVAMAGALAASGAGAQVINRDLFVSNSATNGYGIGADTGACTSQVPCLTPTYAIGIAPTKSHLYLNGAFSGDYLITKTLTIDSVNGATSASLTPSAGASAILEVDTANGGVVTIQNVTINASGSSTAADVLIDAPAGTQTVNLTNDVLVSGTNVPTITNAPNASFNLTISGGAEGGAGFGPKLLLMNSGTITVLPVGFSSTMTPNSTASTLLSYDGGQGLSFAVDANGSGASSGSVVVNLSGMSITDTLPTGNVLLPEITVLNATTTITGNSISCTTGATDPNTECFGIQVSPSGINPLVIPSLSVTKNYTTIASYGGGKAGPWIGTEGFPETCADNGFLQTGTTATVGSCLTTIPAIANGATVTFANTGGSNTTPTSETITYAGGSGGLGTYTGSVSQSFYNTVLYVNGTPYLGHQAATTLTISQVLNISGDSHAINKGEAVYGGPNWSGNQETFVNYLGSGQWQMSQSQTLASGLVFIGAANMTTTGLVEANNSNFTTVVKAHVAEGAVGFCGFQSNITFHANYGAGADYGINDKGCLNTRWVANVSNIGGSTTGDVTTYGSTNFLLEHNTFLRPYLAYGAIYRPAQPNDWYETGYQYPTGTVSGNVVEASVIQPACNIQTSQAVTNFQTGTITPETIVSQGTGTGCAGTYNVSVNQTWAAISPVYIGGVLYDTTQAGTVLTVDSVQGPVFVDAVNTCSSVPLGQLGTTLAGTTYAGNDWFSLNGLPQAGFLWVIDTACTPTYTNVATTSLATWNSTANTSDLSADPQLINYTNVAANLSNLNVRPATSSQIVGGAPVLISGLTDFYLTPFDPLIPSYGAAQFGMTYQGTAPVITTLAGSQPNRGSVDTQYWMGAIGTMAALDTTSGGTDIASPSPVAGYIQSMQFTTSSKPGATTPGVVIAILDDNGVATAAKCVVGQTANQCNYPQSGPPVFVSIGDNLTINYCYSGDTTGATCAAQSGSPTTGRLTSTIQIRSP